MKKSDGDCCCCCGSVKAAPHLEGLLRCDDCSHVWADMRLSPEALQELYAENYFKGQEYLDYDQEAPALERNFRGRLRELKLAFPRGSRMLEIGSAYGFFLKMASRHFRVRGCEISAHAAGVAKSRFNQPVFVGDYLDLRAPKRPYDLVCLWDTVEHLQYPEQYIRKATSELRPGGRLVFSTGDIGSLIARIQGPRWRLIHPPTHLHYFTGRSARTMLEGLGYSKIRISYHPFWRSADAVAYRLLAHEKSTPSRKLYRAMQRLGVLNFFFPINTWDLMTVTATKGS